MCTHNLFLAKISKNMIFLSKSYHSYSIKNASFRNDIFQLHRSNHGDENSDRFQNGHCTFIMPVMHNAQKRLG